MFEILGRKKKPGKTKILIVDDEPNIVQTLKARLEMCNYAVVTACNGREGLQMALGEKPDVILLDIMMPVMDGHEMLEVLRKDPDGRHCSVIMLTATHQTADVGRANAGGIDGYIVKPFDMSELLEKIVLIVKNKTLAVQ